MAESQLFLAQPEPAWSSPALPAATGSCEAKGGPRSLASEALSSY